MSAINFGIGFVSAFLGFFSGYITWLVMEKNIEKGHTDEH